MNEQEYLKQLNINKLGEYSDDAYVVDLLDSTEYGKVFSILDRSDDLDIMQDNQVVTTEGSSLTYESLSQPYLLSLLADWEGNVYQLVVSKI